MNRDERLNEIYNIYGIYDKHILLVELESKTYLISCWKEKVKQLKEEIEKLKSDIEVLVKEQK